MLVEEKDLDFSQFHCCGDEDLYPFGCPSCGRPMIFCYECDTLYRNLHDLTEHDRQVNSFHPEEPIFSCPSCGYSFEYSFIKNGRYKVEREKWISKGLSHLLIAVKDV